jgi:hypothetical protein
MVLASGGSFFHTSFWARVLHDSYNYRPCYLTRVHNGAFTALLPLMEVRSFLTGRRGVSLPFTDYCDPIMSDQDTLQETLGFLKAHGGREKWKYWELRGGELLKDQAPFSSFYYRHILKLSPDVDVLYSQLKGSTKRNIKKASREGVSVYQSNSLDAVKMFYRLHCMTRKKNGVPPQPFYFFERINDHIISRGHGQVLLAAHQGKTIAGAIFLHFGNEAIYKFGASDSSYLHLRPNDLVMWEAIQWYCRSGYTRFCFGRTDADDAGLRQFKNGWGAEETVIRYFTYDIRRKAFRSGKASGVSVPAMIFRRMPVPLSQCIGRALYRHVG